MINQTCWSIKLDDQPNTSIIQALSTLLKVVAGVLGQKWGLAEMMTAIDNMIAEY